MKTIQRGTIVAVNTSDRKGMRKKPVAEATVVPGGIEGDAHASPDWHRQVSLLAYESIAKMQAMGLTVDAGDFAENITTEGVDLVSLPLGSTIKLGQEVVGEVTQIGKECHNRCAIYYQAGDCVMPKEGIFIRVIAGGRIKPGDEVVAEHADTFTATVLTLSDKGSRGERVDEGGPIIKEMLAGAGGLVRHYEIIPDEKDQIVEALKKYASQSDLIVTTGGTGLAPRDVAPEATLEVIEHRVPGIPEAMRSAGMAKTDRAMLSRAEAGIRGTCLIVNLPGSPKAVREGLECILPVLPHAIAKIKGDPADCA